MTVVHEMTATALGASYSAGHLSPEEVVEALLDRIRQLDGSLNAVLTCDATDARRSATSSAGRYRAGRPRSSLDGVPVLVKDNIETVGLTTTFGSAHYRSHVPLEDAAVVAILRSLGMIVLAKTGMHEFAWGITGVNPHYGSVLNPHDRNRISGGSSSGSAAGVAAGYAPLALGTDTGGSLRIPAAYCRVVGFKPSYGALPVAGTFPLAPSLDHLGLLARTPHDLRTLYEQLRTPQDAPARPASRPELSSPMQAVDGGLRVGVAWFDGAASPPNACRRVLEEWAARVGHELIDLELPGLDEAQNIFRKLQGAEALQLHRARGLFPARAAEYGADVRARLEAACKLTADEVIAASAAREAMRRRMTGVFRETDVIVTPTVRMGPWSVEEQLDAGQDIERRREAMIFTVPWNLTGFPACAVPIAETADTAGLSFQVIGRHGDDDLVLRAAESLFACVGPSGLQSQITAVHDQIGARDKPRLIGGQEEHAR